MGKAKTRIEWLDVAKGFGIAFMIIAHTFPLDYPLRHAVFSFHMPLFFILAGYTFRVKPTKEVLSSSFKRLLVPYCLVFVARTIIGWVKADSVSASMVKDAVLSFVFASGTDVELWSIPAAGMIWFLAALFCARVMMNAGTAWLNRKGASLRIQFVFWLAIAFFGICLGEPTKTLPFIGSITEVSHIKLPLSFDIAMVACLFMFVGYLFKAKGFEWLFGKWWSFFAVFIIWLVCVKTSYLELATRSYAFWPCGLLGAFAGTYLVCQVSYCIENHAKVLCKPLAWIGVNSLLLLCIHAFDGYFVAWASLPILAMVNMAYAPIIAGCLRLGVDLLIANVVRRV